MRGMKNGLAIFFMSLILLGVLHLSVRADGFDANFYARKYPDVVAVVGNSPEALYNHYVNFGAKEGRSQNQQEDSAKYQAILDGQAAPPASAPGAAVAVVNQPVNGLPYSTYVDIDIASQTMTFYENGQVKLQSPVVTGNPNRGNGTPTGTFAINSHVAGKRLIGPTWNVWVDTWMQFTPNPCHIGLHDANWRSSFGGDIYQSNGSHGCVNLPHDIAVSLFNSVGVGTPVVVH
ncbi:L,D-transpeptidase [Butyrivibrio sp. LC3010]|uniref:L,D-transpeptidase n=1 Tax=Butyrivibrio sp. LC3010 TaxID=1280680 RepID=UPI000407F2DC|nr:L,D-transpeptidase [Butyrivibrio sp. LC3010]